MSDAEKFFGDWSKYIDFNLLNSILNTLGKESNKLCPEPDKVFRAFALCSLDNLKVIILGQDPYNDLSRATGIAFANPEGVKNYSPSLRVLHQSIKDNYNDLISGVNVFPTLEHWEKQGVLLLNTALTTQCGIVGSHIHLWLPFVSEFLRRLSNDRQDIVYLLLGNQASRCKNFINSKYIIEEAHPSYYARVGQPFPYVFSTIDEMLLSLGKELIYWI